MLSLIVTWNWSRLAQTMAGIFSSGWVVVKISRQTADLVSDRPRSSSLSIGRLFLLQRRVTGIWKRWWVGGRGRRGVTVVRTWRKATRGSLRPRFTPQLDCVTSQEEQIVHSTLFQSTGCDRNPASLDPAHSAWIANDATTCFQRGYLWHQQSRHWIASLLITLSRPMLLEGFHLQ